MSKKKLVVYLTCFVLVYTIYKSFRLNGVNTIDGIFTNVNALERTYYIAQIVASMAMIIGAIIGVWQYVLTSRCERAKIKNDRVEKAVQLSEYYKDNILNKLTVLRYVFKESGITDILEKIKPDDMINFDQNELDEKLSRADIQSLQEIMKSEKIATIIVMADMVYGLGLGSEECINTIKTEDGKEVVSVNKEKILRMFMSEIVNKLLNNMEYFSMYFTHKVADESVVYQSLHQTYIELTQLLYYNMARNNKLNGMCFYTNAVELYKIWYNRYKIKKDNVADRGRKISKGTLSEDID